MIIEHPVWEDIPALRALWKQAFGDTDAFLDSFFFLAFSTECALIAREDDKVVGALYWLDCLWGEKTLSYIYAVATDKDYRGQGVCKALMSQAHRQMEKAGKGTILVPADDGLRAFYRHMGYRDFGGMEEMTCSAGGAPVAAEKLTAHSYAQKRRQLLPKDGVWQEGAFLPFLDVNMGFYGGNNWLLAIQNDFSPEFLGDKAMLPGILKMLQIPQARVRCAGNVPFAMYRGIAEDISTPGYFAFALD